jgi:hypothetical protein
MMRIAVLAIAAFVVIGFAQERLKVSLNHYLEVTEAYPEFFELPPNRRDAWLDQKKINAPHDYYYNHARVGLYHHLNRKQLTLLKWGMAMFFAVLHFALAVGVVLYLTGVKDKPPKNLSPRRMLLKSLLFLYTVAVIGVLVFFVLMRLVQHPDAAYAVARKLLGFMQSPMPLIIVLFGWRLQRSFG